MKKFLHIILLALLFSLDANAVLKEKDLAGTLVILRNELTAIYNENAIRNARYASRSKNAQNNMFDILKKSDQNALMLYSQKKEYVFDLAYACHEATEQYKNFRAQTRPFQRFADKTAFEEARYDSLINTLNGMPDELLDSASLANKAVCLALTVNLQRQLKERNDQMQEYMAQYMKMDAHLKQLNDYASKRYTEIQQNIFQNGGTDYFTLLTSLNSQLNEVEDAVNDKYKSYSRNIHSEWDVKIMGFLFVAILFYGIISSLLSLVVIRYLIPKRLRKPGFMARRRSIILASTVILFAIAIGIIKELANQNFLAMAGDLLVQYAWLIGVIFLSVLGRVKPEQLKSSYRIYSPLILVSFIVIVFRIVLIPNALVNLVFPPIILICAIAQWFTIKKYKENVPSSDLFYAQISLFIFVFSMVCSLIGFTLLAVQALIWWTMQLTCILTIYCIKNWLKAYEQKKSIKDKPITKVWFFYLVHNVVVPVLAIFSIMISVYWAADVFNLSDTVIRFFDYNVVDFENFRISMLSLAIILSLWFGFAYISKLIIEIAKHRFTAEDPRSAQSRIVMIKNVVQVLVWGAWFMTSLVIMRVNTTWLAVIGGGLSTGIGFASKDIIENIYYGISLMMGRIKIGDFIDCDGTRGKVTSISYTSTLIEAMDGSVIAFQNSQLFTLNYKNLTRNHGYVLSKVEFGVAYGTNAKSVIDLIVNTINEKMVFNPSYNKNKMDKGKDKKISVVLSNLADSSVNFILCSWVNVKYQILVESELRTLIYETLNENNIEIPFPQQDVHIINS